MNRFLKKKAPEAVPIPPPVDDAVAKVSRPVSPGLRKSSTSRWRRNKKTVADQKPALDLTHALPSDDDFRTSLLLPNLSARFSMLREQDDPHSLLGKAADDSVLQPRRRSRLIDLAQARPALGDIAEVASVNSSVRPPFARPIREASFTSEDGYGYGSDNDLPRSNSFMNRARPGEGNTLFGGRQKVYMIPKAGTASQGSLGRAVYGDDVGISAFQKSRKHEATEPRISDESQAFDFALDEAATPGELEPTTGDTARDLSHSPSLTSSEKKRSTTSTSRSEARSSFTAGTSVASQPPTAAPSPAAPATQVPTAAPQLKRSDTKTRRLYEQGLDQQMHEQQTSTLTRLNSIHRQRTLTGRPTLGLHGTRSAGNLHDRANNGVYALRPSSPTVATVPSFPFALMRKPSSSRASPDPSWPHSPILDDESEVLHQALEPADRGKATALGAFNRPQHAFDEEQYLERQRQLQRSNSTAAIRKDSAAGLASQHRAARLEQVRQRTGSDASAQFGMQSQQDLSEQSNASQKSAAVRALPTPPIGSSDDKSAFPDTHRTFFGDISASESDDELAAETAFDSRPSPVDHSYGPNHGRWQPTILPSVSEHPAHRQNRSKASLAVADEENGEDDQHSSMGSPAKHSPKRLDTDRAAEAGKDEAPIDPSSLAPTMPLNGMMRHLRQASNQSAISQLSGAATADGDLREWSAPDLGLVDRSMLHVDSAPTLRSSYAESNPFDLDAGSAGDRTETNGQGTQTGPSVSPIDARLLASSRLAEHHDLDIGDVDGGADAEMDGEATPAWPSEMRRQHARGASTETQQERDAFTDELATRRHAIQQNIRNRVEAHSRNASPAGRSNGFKAMLRARPSRESVAMGPEYDRQAPMPQKALKTLGIGPRQVSAAGTESGASDEGRGYSLDTVRSQLPVPHMQTRAPHSEETVRGYPRARSRSRERRPSQPQSRSSPPSHAQSRSRNRANSETAAAARSRSRAGTIYRDDLQKAMIEGTSSSAAAAYPDLVALSPALPSSRDWTPAGAPLDEEDIATGQQPNEAGNEGLGLRNASGGTGYFDRRALHPQPTQNAFGDRTPGSAVSPSLGAFSSQNGHVGSGSARGSPALTPQPSGYSATSPMLISADGPGRDSRATTPTAFSPPLPPHAMPPNGNSGRPPLRKKAVSKHDISEPTLISATSNIDTVDLPPGASLRNGMDERAPPIPAFNPKRRGFFGLGRQTSSDENQARAAALAVSRTRSPEVRSPHAGASMDGFANGVAARDRSASNSPRPSAASSGPGFCAGPGSPGSRTAHDSPGYASASASAVPSVAPSPERVDYGLGRAVAAEAGAVEGAMF